jgi:ubiquinone biosynthesis protein UbiJ
MVENTKTVMKLDAEDKEWLGGLFARADARSEEMEARLAAQIDGLEMTTAELDARIERVETTLLTEFQWASPRDARIRTHNAAFRAIELEIEALADRVAKLESQRPH